jgi:hypothetical protein
VAPLQVTQGCDVSGQSSHPAAVLEYAFGKHQTKAA